MLMMGDDPSYRRPHVVHPPDSPHSLAMGIARDKAMSTLKVLANYH